MNEDAGYTIPQNAPTMPDPLTVLAGVFGRAVDTMAARETRAPEPPSPHMAVSRDGDMVSIQLVVHSDAAKDLLPALGRALSAVTGGTSKKRGRPRKTDTASEPLPGVGP